MGSLPYRAVIVDLDRTLLRTDKSVSDYTRDVLGKWQDAGVYLYAATARPQRAITEYCAMLGFRSVTTLNGARTVTPAGVFEYPILTGSAVSILEKLSRTEETVISVEAEKGLFANRDIHVWSPEVIGRLGELPLGQKVYKILASHPFLPVEQIPVTMPEDVYCSVADRKLLQFMSRSATKWNGILQMLEHDGISAEEAVYFGDDNDDVEPVRRCGLGVAVRNALDCVKAIADDIADSNDEDGVARYLARLAGQ